MGSLKIIPQNDRILAEVIEVKNTTKSGLVITAGGEETVPTTFATILAVSESLKADYKRDEVVYFNGKAGVQVRLGGKKMILLTKGEILAKIEADDLSSIIDSQDLA